MTTKCWNAGKYGASGFIAAVGCCTGVAAWPLPAGRYVTLLLILKLCGWGNFWYSAPSGANTALEQSKLSGLYVWWRWPTGRFAAFFGSVCGFQPMRVQEPGPVAGRLVPAACAMPVLPTAMSASSTVPAIQYFRLITDTPQVGGWGWIAVVIGLSMSARTRTRDSAPRMRRMRIIFIPRSFAVWGDAPP